MISIHNLHWLLLGPALILCLLGPITSSAFQTPTTATATTRQHALGLSPLPGQRQTSQSTTTTSTSLCSSQSPSPSEKENEQDLTASAASDSSSVITVEGVIRERYPDFYSLLIKNENIFRQLDRDYGDTGYTVFVPNAQAFEELGQKKRQQLDDPRNLETAQKMGLCHVVGTEPLSITKLNREDWTVPKTPEGLPALKFGAIVTLGGEVPIGRTKKKVDSGGIGGIIRSLFDKQEVQVDREGNPVTVIVVGPGGRILRSLKIGNNVIHEVDSLVSPMILWRYCDQLRIPGF